MTRIRFELNRPQKIAIAFCTYIIRWLRVDITRSVDYEALQLRVDLLKVASWIDWRIEPSNLQAKEVVRIICNSLKWKQVRNSYIIYIDDSKCFPGTFTPIAKIARFLDCGNEVIKGSYFITSVMLRYQENIYDYWAGFKIRTQR